MLLQLNLLLDLRIALIELYDRYRLAVDLPEEEAAKYCFSYYQRTK